MEQKIIFFYVWSIYPIFFLYKNDSFEVKFVPFGEIRIQIQQETVRPTVNTISMQTLRLDITMK